jgi:2'-5' RNA ligase
MSQIAQSGSMLRLFVALDVPDQVRRNILAAQKLLIAAHSAVVSWPRPEGIHLTLKFLGDISAYRVIDITTALDRAASEVRPFKLKTTIAGGFPNLNRPRVIWWGVDGGNALMNLQLLIEEYLVDAGFDREEKGFHPHLTVGRVKQLKPGSELPQKFVEIQFDPIEWVCHELLLMSSVLKPTGAEYKVVNRSILS